MKQAQLHSASGDGIATFDLTDACPLRCQHCYYYADPGRPPEDLLMGEEELERGIGVLRDAHRLDSAFWVGGEPLLGVGLLRRLLPLFRRNAISTSGMVAIPVDLPAGLLVSLDGPADAHDQLRGSGVFDKVLQNLRPMAPGSFCLSMTLTAPTWRRALTELPRLVDQTRAVGALVGFHVGPAGDPLRVATTDRARALDLLAAQGAPVVNTHAGLSFLALEQTRAGRDDCIYRHGAVAFDARLQLKRPCTFGGAAECGACGCPVVAEQRAMAAGSREARELLRTLFRAHGQS